MRHRNIARRGVSRFAFIDLFAGIGGMRMAFEHAGGTCLYSSEWNKYSQQTYRANFGETPDGDITKADENALPPCREKPVMRTILERNVPDKYTLSDKLWTYLQNYVAKHKAAGHGFGYGIAPFDGISRTLSARYYKDGSEILIAQEGKTRVGLHLANVHACKDSPTPSRLSFPTRRLTGSSAIPSSFP